MIGVDEHGLQIPFRIRDRNADRPAWSIDYPPVYLAGVDELAHSLGIEPTFTGQILIQGERGMYSLIAILKRQTELILELQRRLEGQDK